MSRLEFLIEKRCPHCDWRLNLVDMLIFDPRYPVQCDNCGKFYRNSQVNHFLSWMLSPILFIVLGSVFTVDRWMIFTLMPLMMGASVIMLATPVITEPPYKKVSRHLFRSRRGK